MNKRPLSHFLSLFEVGEADIRKVLSAAMEGGSSWADLYFESTRFRELSMRDGQVISAGLHEDFGVGIRVLHGEKTGYSYCETTALGDMIQAARSAARINSCATSGSIAFTPSKAACGSFYSPRIPWTEYPDSGIVELLRSLETELRRREGRITNTTMRVASCESSVMICDCLGEIGCDERPIGSIAVNIIFSDGRTTESRGCSRSFRCGAELLDPQIVDSLADELLDGIDAMLQAGRPKGGRMSVVIGAGAGGILLHEAMGHAFEADFVRKGQSIFAGRMGERVCPEGINIVDDATWNLNRGALNIDDEGVAGQKTYMVRDGVLNSYLHDRISAAHFGVAPTGNGRRESFRFNPIPRMRLTYMENGTTPPADIIASVKKGIYVDEFSNGEVKIGEGDFTFYVKRGFLIENGRLSAPVKDINIIGNGPRALADIRAVGNDLKIDDSAWTCGKEQNVPVGCGMPSVLIGSLTVGGN